MKTLHHTAIILLAAICMAACRRAEIPGTYQETGQMPPIFPDYAEVTIPYNIAPLNFMIADSAIAQAAARIKSPSGMEITAQSQGAQAIFSISDWSQMLQSSRGQSLQVEVYGADYHGNWVKYQPFDIHVANSKIDPYVSYRLIEPSYSIYENMCISQRCLESFDESVIYSTKKEYGQCVNCHSCQNYKPSSSLLHKRVAAPGTTISIAGRDTTVNLKRGSAISAGVYPAWHPTENLIAFSTNKTHQMFHTQNINKVEVFDTESDLILYDADADSVTAIAQTSSALETFPTWSHDGKYLYYCQSDILPGTFDGDNIRNYKQIKYDIMRLAFDASSKTFSSTPDTIYRASADGKSCTLPRVSPDGSKIIFSEGEYGCFHIWHHDSQIRIMDLNTGEIDSLPALNDRQHADSYPSFSSNGQWIMLASRRADGQFSRIFISYYDGRTAQKAFMLPQEEPSSNIMRLKSYNRPEFMIEKAE